MKRYIGMALCVLLFAIGAWYFHRHQADFRQLLNVGPLDLTWLVLLNLAGRVLIGARLKYLTAPFGVNVSIPEGTGLSMIQAYGNVVAIKGGTAGIAYYLYSAKGFSLDRFVAITGGGFVVTTLVISFAGLIGVGLMSFGQGVGPEIPLIFSLFIAGALAVLFFPRLRLPSSRLSNFVNKVSEGWDTLRGKWSNICKLAVVELAILLSFTLRYLIAFRAFSQPIRLSQAFLLAPPAYLSLMLNITPAGLGVREPILAYMSGILGYTVKGGLGAAVLDSAVMVIVSLVLGPIAAMFLTPRKGQKDASA